MWLQNKHISTPLLVQLAVLTSLSLTLSYLERFIPLDLAVPGIRLGLANTVVVTGLYLYSFPIALSLALLKSGTVFLVNGSALGFWYGLCGTLLSFLGMALLKKRLGKKISPVGVSITGGILHTAGQLTAAILVTKTPALLGYLPLLLLGGGVTGGIVGAMVRGLLPALERISAARQSHSNR